jgi:hypothetical protein
VTEEVWDDDSDDDSIDDVVNERTRRLQRFIALGGGVPIQQELRNLKRLANHEHVSLKDNVTDGHRQIVADLAAGGASKDSIAKIFGIDRKTLDELFEFELATAFTLAKSNLARSLYLSGLSGNDAAAINWLRYHKDSDWESKSRSKNEHSVDAHIEGEIEHKGKTLEEAKAWMQATVAAMMVDPELRNKTPPKAVLPRKDQQAEKSAVPKSKRTIRKPREEDDEDEQE